MNASEKFFYGIGFFVLWAALGLIMAFVVKWTWNYTMPHIFCLPTLSWIRAYCVYILAGFLVSKPHIHFDNKK